jgi:hypothetical protein
MPDSVCHRTQSLSYCLAATLCIPRVVGGWRQRLVPACRSVQNLKPYTSSNLRQLSIGGEHGAFQIRNRGGFSPRIQCSGRLCSRRRWRTCRPRRRPWRPRWTSCQRWLTRYALAALPSQFALARGLHPRPGCTSARTAACAYRDIAAWQRTCIEEQGSRPRPSEVENESAGREEHKQSTLT